MSYEVRTYPEWSWSTSRAKIFKECKRQYYYHYYGSHNGWLDDATEEQRMAYRLKNLTNLYMIFGESLHFIAESSINQWRLLKDFPNRDDIVLSCRKNLNDAFIASQSRSKWLNRPKKSIMLHEIYYNGKLPQKRTEAIKERLEPCIDNLLASKTIHDITQVEDSSILEVEQLNTFNMLDDKLYVKMDLLYRNESGKFIITDWKTGKPDEDNKFQALFYVLYLKDQFPNLKIEDVVIRLEYLMFGECIEIEPTEEMLRWTKQEVVNSIEEMRLYVSDDNLNKPFHKDAFEPEPSKMACSGCNYRELCSDKI
ncbi:hypothetical protein GCM10023310_70590 [Paenibacillus vulneris]|uniref:RecB family exonuclease n=1 Tax=Paenibacillus vulneris TaxID=1133364 RepID=A0ABW3UJ13_9BACL